MEEKKYHVWSLEHAAWWKPNSMGYTHKIEEAGKYYLEEAESICASANLFNIVNEKLVREDDFKKIGDLQKITNSISKKPLELVIDKFNKGYKETNPMGDIINELKNNEYYPIDENVPHVNYEENKKIVIDFKNSREQLILNLYRMPSGKYETVIYSSGKEEIKNKEQKKSKNKLK